jgi:hypothetical protein
LPARLKAFPPRLKSPSSAGRSGGTRPARHKKFTKTSRFLPHIGIAAIDAGGGVANFEIHLTGTLVLSDSDFIA